MKPKFLIGIGLILAAIAAVMVFTIIGNSSMEVKVNDLLAQKASNPNIGERSLKLTGFVVGDSVVYDPATLNLEFDIVHSRDDLINNLATAQRVRVAYQGVKPDTLVHEASAIVTGRLNPDGKFHAGNGPDALLLQCPTKYETMKEAAK
jgi:cytochrome c-type biogenesis protein CcmE